jgi:HPt (histidine-containing phosphotransfer) domain-containing protein
MPEALPVLDPQQLRSLLDLGAEPALIQELLDLFEADVPPRLASLEAALAAGDAAGIMAEAHHLSGSLGNMGLSRFADLARRLEEQGREGRVAEAAPLVTAMPQAYREARLALRETFPA